MFSFIGFVPTNYHLPSDTMDLDQTIITDVRFVRFVANHYHLCSDTISSSREGFLPINYHLHSDVTDFYRTTIPHYEVWWDSTE